MAAPPEPILPAADAGSAADVKLIAGIVARRLRERGLQWHPEL
jgi:hypothetical protein